MYTFGPKFRQAREKARVSMAEAVERAGRTYPYLSRVELGDIRAGSDYKDALYEAIGADEATRTRLDKLWLRDVKSEKPRPFVDFSHAMKAALESSDVLQQHVAERMKVSSTAVGFWARGEKIPSKQTFDDLVALLENHGASNESIAGLKRAYMTEFLLNSKSLKGLTDAERNAVVQAAMANKI
jgi:transcriptional regulator with XRE-family HTH domain